MHDSQQFEPPKFATPPGTRLDLPHDDHSPPRRFADPSVRVRNTRALCHAIAAGDFEQLTELTTPQVELHLQAEMPYGGVYEGHVGLATALLKVKSHWALYEPVAEEIQTVGEHTVTQGRLKVQANSGSPEELPFTLFTKFDGELIACTHEYSDTAEMLQLLGE